MNTATSAETMSPISLAYYSIPEPNMFDLQERVAKMSRRAKRFGRGEIKLNVTGMELHSSGKYNVLTVELQGVEPVVSGWTFVASINHDHEAGNIMRYTPPFTADQVDVKYRTNGPICEHCNLNRLRKDTYIVRNKETKEERQVGRTCLTEFFNGLSLNHVAEYAEMLGNIGVMMEEATFPPEEGKIAMRKPMYYNLIRILKLSAAIIRVRGTFVSGTRAYETGTISTANLVKHVLFTGSVSEMQEYAETEDDIAIATAAMEWGANLDDSNEYQWNVRVLCTSEMVTMQQIGLAVSIVGVYLRNRVSENTLPSDFIGTIDQRHTFEAKLNQVIPTTFSNLNILKIGRAHV